MYHLTIDGRTAHISPATKLRLELTSSVGDSDALKAKVVYPIDLPDCDINAMVFQHAHILHVVYNYKVYNAQLSFRGKQIISGELVLLGTSVSGYHVTIVDKGMSNDFLEQMLTDIDIPSVKMVDKPHIQLAGYMTGVVYGINITDFELPMVYAPEFYDDNDEFGTEDNWFQADADNGVRGKYQNRWNINAFLWNRPSATQNMNIYTFVPYPKLYNTLQKVFGINNIHIYGSFLDKVKKERILLNSSRTLDDKFFNPIKFRVRKKNAQTLMRFSDGNTSAHYPLTFSSITDYPTNYEYIGVPWSGYWMSGTWHAYGVPEVPDFPNIQSEYSIDMDLFVYIFNCMEEASIFITVWNLPLGSQTPYIIKEVEFNPPAGSFITYPLKYRDSLILKHGDQISITLRHVGFGQAQTSFEEHNNSPVGTILQSSDSYLEMKNMTLEKYNAGKSHFKLNQHLPEITVAEFLNVLRQTFGVVIYADADKRELEMSMYSDLIASDGYVDISNYVVPFSAERIFEEVSNQKITYKHETETPAGSKWNLETYINFHNLPSTAIAGAKAIVLADGMVYQYILNEEEERYKWTASYPYSKTQNDTATEEVNIDCNILACTERISKLFPITTAKAISDKFSTNGETIMGVLYYHGWVKDLGSIYYPFASAYGYDVNGNKLNVLPMFESGSGSNGEVHTIPYFKASKSYESEKVQLKVPLHVMEELFTLLKPQREKGATAKRKVMLNSVKYIPLSMAFILDGAQQNIETELTIIKDAR